MRWGQVFLILCVAGMIAAITSVYVAPRIQSSVASGTAPRIAMVTPDEMTGRRSAHLTLRADGHYWGRALVNSKASVDFMVDTGASVVALTWRDAQKMGIDPRQLDYRWDIRTAGGVVKGASVLIDSIRINQVHIRNVEAMVLPSDLEQSLLGMSFLRELYSYEFRGDRLIIRQ